MQIFINKLVYKTILNATFKEKKDRFFICFLRAIQLWLYINFGFLTKLYKKLPNFSIEKKNSHQTFCVFIILVRYHKQSTYVYIMLTFLALSRVCLRDIQFLCNPDWEVPSLTSMSLMKPQEQRNIFNIPKRKTEAKVRLSYLHLWFCTSLRHGVPRHHR